MKKNLSVFILGILVTAIAISYLIYERGFNIFDNEKFDQKLWLESRIMNDSEVTKRGPGLPRLYMVKDLTENYIKTGMDKKEVEDLLGKNESSKERKISYFIGIFGYKSCGLNIELDSNNKVTSANYYCT